MQTEHATLARSGSTIHYWLSGPAGRPLVTLSHGATMDHRMFDAQVEALAGEYRVLTWDARGHGQSQPIGDAFTITRCAEDLLALVHAAGYEQAVFAGQSMGGYIAQEAVFRFPESALALVTIGTTDITSGYSFSDRLLLGLTPSIVRMWPYEHLKRTTARSIAGQADTQAYAYEAMSQVSQRDVATIMGAVAAGLHAEAGYRIPVPALLTHGANDSSGRIRDYAPRWQAQQPQAEFVTIPDAGHNANQDNAAFFNRILLDFLHRHVPVA
jgi:pimeloyl-ACP methyl ester carboxylesterase